MAEFKPVFGAPEFRPRAVVDTASRARQQANQQIQQMRDAMNWNRQQDRWAQEDARAQSNVWKDLAPLAKGAADLYRDIELQSAKDRKTGDIYAGLIGDLEPNPAEAALDEEGRVEAEERASVAADIENKEDDPALAQTVRRQESGNAKGYKAQQVDLLAAQTDYRPWLNNYLENSSAKLRGTDILLSEAIYSGDPNLVSRAVAQAQNAFFQKYKNGNLLLATKDSLVKALRGVIPAANGSLSSQYLNAGIEENRRVKRQSSQSQAYSVGTTVRGADLQDRWNRLSENAWLSGGYKTRGQANDDMVRSLSDGLADAGNVDALKALKRIQKVQGNSGTLLGGQYSQVINQAILKAEGKEERLERQKDKEISDRMYQALRLVEPGPGAQQRREEIVSAAAQEHIDNGNEAKGRELLSRVESLSIDPSSQVTIARYEDMIDSGEMRTAAEINRAQAEGLISDEDAVKLNTRLDDQLGLQSPKSKQDKLITDGYAKRFEQTFLPAMGLKKDPTGLIAESRDTPYIDSGQAKLLLNQLQQDLNRTANNYLRRNRDLSPADRQAGLTAELDSWWKKNVTTTGGKWHHQDIIDSLNSTRSDKLDDKRQAYYSNLAGTPSDLTEYFGTYTKNQTANWSEERGVKDYKPTSFSLYRQDKIIPPRFVDTYAQEYNDTGTLNPSLIKTADQLNVTPLALLQQQLDAYGKDPVMVKPYEPKSFVTPQDVSVLKPQEVVKSLQSFGLSNGGAEYVSKAYRFGTSDQLVLFLTSLKENDPEAFNALKSSWNTPRNFATALEDVVVDPSGYVGSNDVVDTGLKDYKGRSIKLRKDASQQFISLVGAMQEEGIAFDPNDVNNVYRDAKEYKRLKAQGYNAAAGGHHNFGTGMDVEKSTPLHDFMIRRGPEFGWNINNYKGSHGGHFEYTN